MPPLTWTISGVEIQKQRLSETCGKSRGIFAAFAVFFALAYATLALIGYQEDRSAWAVWSAFVSYGTERFPLFEAIQNVVIALFGVTLAIGFALALLCLIHRIRPSREVVYRLDEKGVTTLTQNKERSLPWNSFEPFEEDEGALHHFSLLTKSGQEEISLYVNIGREAEVRDYLSRYLRNGAIESVE